MKTILTIACVVVILIAGAQIFVMHQNNKTEKVQYTIIKKFKDIEIRSYPKLIVATTVCGTGNYENNSGRGFRKIAGFIFGGNEENSQIAMTSPVKMTLGDTMQMSFYMPTNYSQNELPNPDDNTVIIKEESRKTVAAIEFGGWADQEKINLYQKKMEKILKSKKIEHEGDFAYLGYNAPYEIFNRKNEIIVSVKNFD